MPQVHNLACPLCLLENKGENPIMTQQGKLGHFCKNDHTFDNDVLMTARPMTNPPPQPGPKIQPGMVKFEVSIHENDLNALKTRFGARLPATAAAILKALLDPGAFIVGGEDVQNIFERIGKKIGDSQTLVGVLWELDQARIESQNAVNNLRTSTPQTVQLATPGQAGLFIEPAESVMTALREVAKTREQTPEAVVADVLDRATKNEWL